MKRKLIAFTLLMTIALSLAGCASNGTDLCDPIIRDYLDTKNPEQQADILSKCSGTRLTFQSLTFSWESSVAQKFTVTFADNKAYENPYIYETFVASITPDGIFVPGKTYYWKVEGQADGSLIHEDSFTLTDSPVRFITTSSVSNVRDLGGWKTEDGKTVQYGLLYRGGMTNTGSQNNFPEKDVILFRDTLGIKTEIDLRTPGQDDRNQTVSILGEDAPYCKTPIQGYCHIIPSFQQSDPVSRSYDRTSTRSIREIFHLLADENNYPVFFHCNAGADRTGTLAYLINGVLGVSYEDLTRDFELTSFSAAGRRWRSDIIGGTAFDESGVMQDDRENYVAWGKMHQMMTQEYGAGSLKKTIENYLTQVCGVPQEDIDSLRRIMLK